LSAQGGSELREAEDTRFGLCATSMEGTLATLLIGRTCRNAISAAWFIILVR
jgi:hypothetical protein